MNPKPIENGVIMQPTGEEPPVDVGVPALGQPGYKSVNPVKPYEGYGDPVPETQEPGPDPRLAGRTALTGIPLSDAGRKQSYTPPKGSLLSGRNRPE